MIVNLQNSLVFRMLIIFAKNGLQNNVIHILRILIKVALSSFSKLHLLYALTNNYAKKVVLGHEVKECQLFFILQLHYLAELFLINLP